MQPRKLLTALMSLCLAAGAATAQERMNTTASLSGFKFTLVDLDPSDGVAPSFSLVAGPYPYTPRLLSVYGSLRDEYTGSITAEYRTEEYFPGPVSDSLSANGYRLSGRVGVPADAASLNLSVSAAADTQAQSGGFYTSSSFMRNVLVSPHTALLVSAVMDYDVSMQNVVGDDGRPYRGNLMYRSELRIAGFAGTSDLDFSQDSRLDRSKWFEGGDTSIGHTPLIVRFYNDADVQAEGTFSAFLEGSGSYLTSPPPVPEPTTMGLMLGGLALVGARARRKGRLQT